MAAVAPSALAGKPPPAPTSVVQFNPSGTALTATEGQPGSVSVVITRSTSVGSASFNVDVVPGTASLADVTLLGAVPPDWTNPITMPAGVTTRTMLLGIVDDTLTESPESLQIKLSNPGTNTQIGKKNTATLTIQDNDPCSPASVNDPPSATEGSPITFTVSMAAPCQLPVQVHWATAAGGTATAGTDYPSPQSGNVAIAAGLTSATFNVATTDDPTDEPDQTVNVNLSAPVNTTIADNLGVGTILDNDAAPGVTMSDNPTAVEGNDLVYTIKLSAVSEKAASGTFETWPSNVPDLRYTPVVTTPWSIAAGFTTTTVHVPTTDDAFSQVANQTVWGHLLTATNAVIDTSFGGAFPDFSSDLALNDAWSHGILQDNDAGYGFESGDLTGWNTYTDGGAPVASASNVSANTGTFSALLGTPCLNVGTCSGEPSGTSAVYRDITVPASGTTTLSFWVNELGDNNALDDQGAQIKDATTFAVLDTIFDDSSNNGGGVWVQKTKDLTPFAGQTVQLIWFVYQDGLGAPTGMYLDDVQLFHTP